MVDIFKALSEESRLRILSLLMDNEMCVCEIESSLKMTQSNVSRHLTALKQSGILENYKKAQWTYYKVNPRFIMDNKELWEYLKRNIKELPSYSKDIESYLECQKQDLCSCGLKPH